MVGRKEQDYQHNCHQSEQIDKESIIPLDIRKKPRKQRRYDTAHLIHGRT